MKQSSSSYYVAEPSSLLKLLEKEKETKRALQARILYYSIPLLSRHTSPNLELTKSDVSFLSQELERLEHEVRQQRDDTTMTKLKEELPATLLTGMNCGQCTQYKSLQARLKTNYKSKYGHYNKKWKICGKYILWVLEELWSFKVLFLVGL